MTGAEVSHGVSEPGESQTEAAARRLLKATRDRVATQPVRELLTVSGGDLDAAINAAYEVQLSVRRTLLAETGARVVGRKIGLTSPSVQRQFGVHQPDFGVLTDDMALTDNSCVPLRRFLQPRIEGEVAFVLDSDLPERPTVVDVLRATEFLLPAIEIVDSRVAGWDIDITDTIADNASSGAFVLGATPISPVGIDLGPLGMALEHRGELTASGIGSDCLGTPAAAVTWLAREVSRRGEPLRAGEVVLAGAWGPMVTVAAPGTYLARFEGIGEVRVTFVEEEMQARA